MIFKIILSLFAKDIESARQELFVYVCNELYAL